MADGSGKGRPPRRRHRFLNVQVAFFRPLWRRVATLALIGIWTGVEFFHGSPYWGALAAGIGAYVAYQFFVVFDPAEEKEQGQ